MSVTSTAVTLYSGHSVAQSEISDWATECPEYKVTAVEVTLTNRRSEWQERDAERSRISRRVAVTAAE